MPTVRLRKLDGTDEIVEIPGRLSPDQNVLLWPPGGSGYWKNVRRRNLPVPSTGGV